MKNSNSKWWIPSIFLAFLFLVTIGSQNINAQTICNTVAGPGAIGDLSGNGNFGNTSGPYFLRIYVHVVRRTDGTGGQTPGQAREALEYLNQDFAPHNIFFVWDCGIDYIDNDGYYNSSGTGSIFNVNPHTDGIDIYLFRDQPAPNANGNGLAQNIGAKAFFVMGNYWEPPYGSLVRSHVTSHEMGHCLGLWHTWQTQSGCTSFVNGTNCSTCADFVCDTPADPGWNFQIDYPECEWQNSGNDPNGDPYAPDPHLVMAYTHPNCMEYFSTGQGERMRQIISITPLLQGCLINPDFFGHTITTNTTWTTANTPNNGNVLIENDLVIEGGATLTINAGVTVHFGEQSRLTIKPNARLVLNGTLTGMGCRGFTWQGVKVWGSSPTQSQYAIGGVRAQGRIECRPGSLIENAKTGIQLYGPTYTLAGGQISCSGATIKNCPIGVDFAPYQNFWPFSVPAGQQGQPRNYAGSFSGTTFLTDDDYPHDQPFFSFVKMVGVNSISLSGCSYTNARTITGGSIEDWGYGIFANDAGFSVIATGVGNTYPPSSYIFSGFSGLGYGIYTSRIVTNRPYTVRQANFEKCFVGIRNKTVTGGTLLFNNFNLGELPSTDPTGDQVGVIFETDVSGFTCETNDFTNGGGNAETTIGTICINTGIANKTIRKNKFDNLTFGNIANQQNASKLPQDGIRGLYYDCNKNFDVLDMDFSVPDGRIKAKQGLEIPDPLNPTVVTYGAAGNRFSYTDIDFSNAGSAIEYFFNLNGQNEEPLTTQGNFTKTPTDKTNACPTTFCEPPCKTREERDLLKSDFYVKRSTYGVVRSDYIASPTEDKARQMAYYQRAMDEAAYMVVIHELYDTTSFSADTLRTWVGNLGSIEGDLWLADERLCIGNSSSAIALLNATITKYQLSGDEQSDIENYKSLVNILTGKPWYSLDEATLQSVKGYLAANGYSEGWAKSIVTLHGGHFPAEYIKTGIGERSNDGQIAHGDAPEEWLKVRPNPAKDFVGFSFDLPKEAVDATVRIYGVSGKLLLQQTGLPTTGSFTWETGANPSGVYFYHLLVDGAVLQSGKIILNK